MVSRRLVICEHCDTVHRRAEIPRGSYAHCERCGQALYGNRTTRVEPMLAITIAALIVFVIANVFPIVEVRLGAERTSTTLIGAIVDSYQSEMAPVAGFAAAMVFLFPLAFLLLCLYLFLPLYLRRPVPAFGTAMYLLRLVRPWSMVEVFMLGVLVALVKLTADTDVYPAAGLWGFAGLTLLMASLNSVDLKELWAMSARGGGR